GPARSERWAEGSRFGVTGPRPGGGPGRFYAEGRTGCTSAAERAGIVQSTGSRPAAMSASLAREKGRLPKNPLRADSGEGWADSMITCRSVSISAFFLRADAP